jgi:CBS domain-containing protein
MEKAMKTLARDVMTPDPACCTPETTLDQVAKLMLLNDCGEIPIVDAANSPIGVVTDRDIVCRVVAEGKHPAAYTAELCMTQPVRTVRLDDSVDEAVATMEQHQIRRVPVVDDGGSCVGIIALADVARRGPVEEVAEPVREVSQETDRDSRL